MTVKKKPDRKRKIETFASIAAAGDRCREELLSRYDEVRDNKIYCDRMSGVSLADSLIAADITVGKDESEYLAKCASGEIDRLLVEVDAKNLLNTDGRLIKAETFASLAAAGDRCREELLSRYDELRDEKIYCDVMSGVSAADAVIAADITVGKKESEYLIKSASGEIDQLFADIKAKKLLNFEKLAQAADNDKTDPAIIEAINSFQETVLGIKGNKMIVVSSHVSGTAPFVIDVTDGGVFGHNESHQKLFRASINNALQQSGFVAVYQDLILKTKVVLPDGKVEWVPHKNLYGFVFKEGQWVSVPADFLKKNSKKNAKTGKMRESSANVFYCQYKGKA